MGEIDATGIRATYDATLLRELWAGQNEQPPTAPGDNPTGANSNTLAVAEYTLGASMIRAALAGVLAAQSTQSTPPFNPATATRADWQRRALEQAGIDPANWDPSQGFPHNRENVTKVYDYYQRLYNEHPELRWAGMARLAGGTVYGGLQQIEDAQQKLGLGRWLPPIGPAGPIREGTILARRELEFAERKLLEMQRSIFTDLAWQHQAYAEGGIQALESAFRRGEITADNLRAWQDIASGNEDRIWRGNTALLRREQYDILNDYYASMRNRALSGWVLSTAMSHMAESPIPGGRSFQDVVPGGDIMKFEDRWRWIETDMLPAWQRLTPEHRSVLVNQPLQDLVDRKFAHDPTKPPPPEPQRRERPWWLPTPILPPILPPWLR